MPVHDSKLPLFPYDQIEIINLSLDLTEPRTNLIEIINLSLDLTEPRTNLVASGFVYNVNG